MSSSTQQPDDQRKATPLDEWLQQDDAPPASIPTYPNPPDHRQRQPKLEQPIEPAPKSTNLKPGLTVEQAFAAFESREQNEPSVVDVAIKAASHGVKVLGPLLAEVTNWVPADQSGEITRIIGTALGRIRTDAALVAKAYQVPEDETPAWLVSQISGMLMPVLVSAIGRNNGTVLNSDDTSYLQPLLDLVGSAENITLFLPNNNIDTEWQLMKSLAMATSNVMTEYNAFSYFHDDPEYVAKSVSEFIHDRVIEGTLADLGERWDFTDKERAYMGVSLISEAGKMLARCWESSMAGTMEFVRDQTKDQQRHILANGYPLEHIFDSFERIYRGVEVSAESALKAMAPMRERFPEQVTKHVPGMR